MQEAYTFDDVALVPQYNNIDSRLSASTGSWLSSRCEIGIPILAANMDTVISDELAKILMDHGSLPIYHRFTRTIEEQIESVRKCPGFISCGIDPNLDDLEKLFSAGAVGVCIDVAHGHCQRMIDLIHRIKDRFPDKEIIAGNICTPEAVHDLCIAGANAVKVGIGPGACCTTRMVTGVGVPQFTAIRNCAKVAERLRIPIIADGGIRNSRDFVLAIAAGASTVMIGGLFARTYESAAPKEIINGTMYAKYRGQASKEFQEDFYGRIKSGTIAEGKEFLTKCSGSATELIGQLLAGLRSGMTYMGSRNIKELHRKAKFVRTTNNYQKESNVRENISE